MTEQEVFNRLESIVNRALIVRYIYKQGGNAPMGAVVTLLEDMCADAQDIAVGFCVREQNST